MFQFYSDFFIANPKWSNNGYPTSAGKTSPQQKSVVCSGHFEDHFLDRIEQTVRMRAGAIPTIF